MTLDDLELYKLEFSENLTGFCRFGTQQQLNGAVSSATAL